MLVVSSKSFHFSFLLNTTAIWRSSCSSIYQILQERIVIICALLYLRFMLIFCCVLCTVKPVEGSRRREPTSVSSYFELSLRPNNNKASHHEDSNRANKRKERRDLSERERCLKLILLASSFFFKLQADPRERKMG